MILKVHSLLLRDRLSADGKMLKKPQQQLQHWLGAKGLGPSAPLGSCRRAVCPWRKVLSQQQEPLHQSRTLIKCRRCKDMCRSSTAHLSAASPGNLLWFCSLQNKITVQKQELLIKISKTNHYLTRMGWIQSYCWGICGRSFTLGNNMRSLSFSRGSWRSSVLNLPET